MGRHQGVKGLSSNLKTDIVSNLILWVVEGSTFFGLRPLRPKNAKIGLNFGLVFFFTWINLDPNFPGNFKRVQICQKSDLNAIKKWPTCDSGAHIIIFLPL